MANLSNSTKEIWKDIPGLKGKYQASSLGNIRSVDRLSFVSGGHRLEEGRVLKLAQNKNGYMLTGLSINGKKKNFVVHRLIAKTFIPNIANKPIVNHINGVRSDNRVENLEWCTNSENMIHAFKYLGHSNPKGEQDKRSIKMIVTYPDGREEIIYGISGAARKLNLHASNVMVVLKGKRPHTKGYKFRYATLPAPEKK